ncbi:aa3-type cytochrome oxidase subunit II [Jiangella anatolica]|uniref:cytochrome-c oxidase n=1 Tax=Jiangella anatolica TaxID=2670374 RepID=A0A2W2C262_9ACTN|nr:cytochrome c oxidase subunit II [Jiangella anatolica]PZF82279.1 cytochrome c oxidase subunit II [Jiangella anatolica]
MSQSGRVRSARRRVTTAAVLLLGTVFVLGGCSAQQRDEWSRLALPEPATEETSLIGNLWIGSWIAAFAVGVLVWGLIIWAVIAYRRRDDELPKQTRFNIPIEFLYTVAPLFVLVPLFWFTADHQEQITDTSAEPDLVVNVIGQQWSWTFNYMDEDVHDIGTINDRPTLYLPIGQTVRFDLESPDVIHSFWIPAFYMKMDVIPGHPNAFQVTPDREGSYVGRCAELCGAYHQSMLFDVEVVSEQEYQDHIADLREAGQEGIIEPPIRGAYDDEVLDEENTGGGHE